MSSPKKQSKSKSSPEKETNSGLNNGSNNQNERQNKGEGVRTTPDNSHSSNINSYKNYSLPKNNYHLFVGKHPSLCRKTSPQNSRQHSNNYSEVKPFVRMFCQNKDSMSDPKSESDLNYRKMITNNENNSLDQKTGNEFQFSIMSYNILSQNLLEDHSELYENCKSSALCWPQRGHRILKELLDSNCDIFCLQEVHSQHFDELYMPSLKRKGYNFVFKQRTGDKMDGCAIIYKENKFSLLNTIKLDFMRKDMSSVLDRDNIAIIVELKPKRFNRDIKLVVANTHLLYNPKRGDVKLAQIRLLLAEIDKMAKISLNDHNFDYNPIILCGDFNSAPYSHIYQFITNGFANFEGIKIGDISGQRDGSGRGRNMTDNHLKLLGVSLDTRFENSSDNSTEEEANKMLIKHNFNLKSVFRSENGLGHKLISTSNYNDSSLVDYIFYDHKKLRLRAFQKLFTVNQINRIGNIPNDVLGSDHLSLKAIFSIK